MPVHGLAAIANDDLFAERELFESGAGDLGLGPGGEILSALRQLGRLGADEAHHHAGIEDHGVAIGDRNHRAARPVGEAGAGPRAYRHGDQHRQSPNSEHIIEPQVPPQTRRNKLHQIAAKFFPPAPQSRTLSASALGGASPAIGCPIKPMLAEFLVYAASRKATPPAFRRYLGDAVGIWRHGERQARAWAPHLAKARGLIDSTIDDLASRRTVVVLGSGPLFDIPLESLARTFQRVVLVDRVHLSTIAPRLRPLRERRACNGGICRRWRSPTRWGSSARFRISTGSSPPCLVSRLAQHGARRAGSARGRSAISTRWRRLPCPVTLITDLDYRVFNRHGVMLDHADLLFGRTVPRTRPALEMGGRAVSRGAPAYPPRPLGRGLARLAPRLAARPNETLSYDRKG